MGQAGKPLQAKDSARKGGEAGEKVVFRETAAKYAGPEQTLCGQRKMRKRGRVQNLESSTSTGGNESHRGACTVRSAARSRVGQSERDDLGNLKARAAKTEEGDQFESSVYSVSGTWRAAGRLGEWRERGVLRTPAFS